PPTSRAGSRCPSGRPDRGGGRRARGARRPPVSPHSTPRTPRPCSVTHRRSDAAPQPGAGTPTGGSPPEPGADQPSLTPGGHLHDEEVAVRVLGKLGDR